MKKYSFFWLLLLFLLEVTHGQELYFKPFLRYNQSISSQEAPQYFTMDIPVPAGTGYNSIPVSSVIKKFSLSSGFKYGGTLGYKFNETLGVEFGIEYLKTSQTIESDNISQFAWVGITDWNFKSVNSLPSFTFGRMHNKSVFTGKFGPIIGIAWLDNSIYTKDYGFRKTYSFNKSLSLGYQFGFEYNYFFQSNFSMVLECGVENYAYTPKTAKLTDYRIGGGNIAQDSPINIKEIEYRGEIRNLIYKYSYYGYAANPDKPDVRIKETTRMNSIYFGVGVKYVIIKK